jgi:hypothetical protein
MTPRKRLVLLGSAVALLASIINAPPGVTDPLGSERMALFRSTPVIDPGAVAVLSDPGVQLTAPGDGRLRGDGIALVITGGALTDHAGQGNQAVSAGPDHHLIVFGLRQILQTPVTPTPVGANPPTAPTPNLALVVAGQRRNIDLNALSSSNQAYFVASVPAGAGDVDLELSAAGYSQHFNLMTLSRPGPDPTVLYRDPDNPAIAATDTSAVGVAATVVPNDGNTYQIMVSGGTVTLGWFAPDPAMDTPASTNQAFLTVSADAEPTATRFKEHSVIVASAVPATKVHLVLADGTRLDATHTGDTTALVSGTYYFTVPADIAAATLSVDAYTAPGSEFLVASGMPATIAVSAFTIPLPLTPPPAPRPTTPATVLKLIAGGTATDTSPGGSQAGTKKGSSSQAPLWLVLILLAIAGAVAWTALRRRRTKTPQEVGDTQPQEWPPSAVPAGVARRAPAEQNGSDPARSPVARTATMASTVTAPPSAPAPPSRPERLPFGPPDRPAPTPDPAPVSPLPPAGLAPDPVPTARREILLLGPLETSGFAAGALRPKEMEILIFLALNADRAFTNDEIRNTIASPDDDEANPKSIRTYLSRIRNVIGVEFLPDAVGGRYRVNGVGTDVARLQTILRQAAGAKDNDVAVAHLTEALRLVRGVVFVDCDFRWNHLRVTNLQRDIVNAADRLARLARERRHPALVIWAAEQGLAAITQPDDRLAAHQLIARSAEGPAALAQAWQEVVARYAQVGDAPDPDLVALYDRLRRGEERF